MSLVGNNIIYNSSFDTFDIDTNTSLYYIFFTEEQTNNFCWDCTGTYVSIQNGVTEFDYPDPMDIGMTQFVSIQNTATLQQTVNPTVNGTYQLSFNYASRNNFYLNQLQIYFGGNLIDTILDASAGWNTYTTNISVMNTFSKILSFKG